MASKAEELAVKHDRFGSSFYRLLTAVNEALEWAAQQCEADLLHQEGVIVAAEKRFDSGHSEKTARRIAERIRAGKSEATR